MEISLQMYPSEIMLIININTRFHGNTTFSYLVVNEVTLICKKHKENVL